MKESKTIFWESSDYLNKIVSLIVYLARRKYQVVLGKKGVLLDEQFVSVFFNFQVIFWSNVFGLFFKVS